MAHAIAQFINLSSSVKLADNGQFNGSTKSTARASSRTTSFSGLRGTRDGKRSGQVLKGQGRPGGSRPFLPLQRGTNALNWMVGKTLHSKVAIPALVKQRRSSRIMPRAAMFEHFTEKGIKVVLLAQEVASLILLGLIREGTRFAAKVFDSMGIRLKDADALVEVEKLIAKTLREIEIQITPEFRESILRQTDVSLSLAKQLISSTKAESKNLVFSPLSIQIVLGMIAAGSKGPTQVQLLEFLKSNSIQELNSLSSKLVNLLYADGGPLGGPHLSFANGVWVDSCYNLRPAFKQIVDQDYKAVSDHVDFQTKAEEVRQEVNKWAKEQTNGLIKEILPSGSVKESTKLIFANALYFKGIWESNFDKSKTKKDKFFLLNGTETEVPFMRSYGYKYIEEFDGFKVLKLPYKQGKDYKRKFSMYFYLPNAKDGLPSLLDKIGSESRFIEHHLPQESVRVGDFRIPKFKMDFGLEATNDLKQLGLVLPFSKDEADLTEIVGSRLHVSNIFHRSFIEVNEKGTEVAAATVARLGFQRAMLPPKPEEVFDFVADHPFLFVIREDLTGAVFFIGQVLNPDFS